MSLFFWFWIFWLSRGGGGEGRAYTSRLMVTGAETNCQYLPRDTVSPRVTWVRGGGGWGPLVLATVALQGRIIALLEYQVTGPDAAETGSWHIRDKTRYKGQQAWHVLWLASRMFTSGFLPKRRRNWRDTCYNWNATFILTMFHGHFPRPIAKWKIAHL